MPRTTNAVASRKRRKRRLALAKGFYGSRSKLFRQATEAVDRAMALNYAHRKERKRDFRSLWIVRLSAACRANGISYSRFIEGLSRQPEAGSKLFTNTLISVGLIESMAIIATVVALIMLYANPLIK